MNDTIILTEIKTLFARLKTEVTISNSSNETDINIHAENIIRRILPYLYKSNILNAGKSIKKNNESFDLFDESGQYAFQITSTNVNKKIIESVTSFVKYSWQEKYKEIYIILIGYDKKQYNKSTINKLASIIKNRFDFNISKNIIDLNDLYESIKELNHTETYKSIRNILKEQFDTLTYSNNLKIELIDFFEEYKENVITKYRRINFFGLDVSSKPSEVELESLFVSSIFKRHSNVINTQGSYHHSSFKFDKLQIKDIESLGKQGIPGLKITIPSDSLLTYSPSNLERLLFSEFLKPFEEEYSISNFFSFINKTIILGNPGAGKSSLIKYITLKILKKTVEVFSNNEPLDLIPFRVQLYQYNQRKKSNSDNINSYLFNYIQKDLSVKNISTLLLNHILEKLNCIVFFDGLDEIFDIQDRLSVRDDIEIFAKNHLKCKVIVTSRFESNTEVSFDNTIFSTFEVQGFNDEQIDQYIEKWYTIVETEEFYKNEEIENLKVELKKIDSELIKNPLLLTLILIIYKNERELPTSKFDIYKGCTNTIVETRDKKEKRIDYTTAVLNKIGVFSSLAYWQFTKEIEEKKSITNNEVIKFLSSELFPDFDDVDLSEQAATEFLEFAKVRSIYFENSFTHKTFLEYFTAHYIYTEYFIVYENRPLLNELLSTYIGSASWAVIFELLFCEIDAQVRNSKIIDTYILDYTSNNNIKAINFFLQIIKYLRNISQPVITQLFVRSYKYCFNEDNIKHSNLEHKVCFENISSLKTNVRFNKLINDAFNLSINDLFSDQQKYLARVFIYEQYYYNIENISPTISNFITTTEINEPYEFILLNYKKLSDWEEYFNVLKEFTNKYTVKAACKNYESVYYKDLFEDGKYFNWIIKAIFSPGKIEILTKNYRKIRSLGYARHHLIEAITKCVSKNKYTFAELNNLLKHTKDETLRKVLKVYLEKFFPDNNALLRLNNNKQLKKVNRR